MQFRPELPVAELCTSLQANITLGFSDSIEKLSILAFQQAIQMSYAWRCVRRGAAASQQY